MLPLHVLRNSSETLPSRADTPVIGRIARGVFLLDVRTVMDDDLPLVATALEGLAMG